MPGEMTQEELLIEKLQTELKIAKQECKQNAMYKYQLRDMKK